MYNSQLDAFIKVADSGSFSKAAEAMYISAPAIIQQINLLEASRGFKLFARSNHGVKMTPAGRSLYYVLIMQPVYTDIHNNLVTIPLERNYTLPYGLMYANEPTMATKKFIQYLKEN